MTSQTLFVCLLDTLASFLYNLSERLELDYEPLKACSGTGPSAQHVQRLKVEKVVATWIASFCENNDVFHRGQFGCRQGRSTLDAVAQLVAKVENTWAKKRTALALLLDVRGAFDRVDKRQLLKRMTQIGIEGNMIRWVDSFLSDRRAMLVIDGRTGQTYAIQAGLPQGSPVSPVLFILSVSALFQWLEDRHATLQAISFVDDIGLVVECDELEEGAEHLERIAEDTMQWGSDNKVEFEVSKTEVLVFSRRRKTLQEAKAVSIRIGQQTLAIKQEATRWPGWFTINQSQSDSSD